MSNPEQELQTLGEFLQLKSPIDGSSLDGSRSDSYRTAWEHKYCRRTPWHRVRMNRWQRAFGERISFFGYDLNDLATCAPVSIPSAGATPTRSRPTIPDSLRAPRPAP